jgi:RND superfamily putative drug exporter
MALNLSTEAIARATSRRPWLTIGIWSLLFVLAGFLRATLFDDVITTKFEPTNSPESKVGDTLIERLTGPKGTNEVVIVQSQTLTVDAPEFQQKVSVITSALADLGPDIIRPDTLFNYYQTRAGALVSEDRQSTIIPFTMAGDFDDGSDHIEEVSDAVDGFKGDPRLKVLMVGQATVGLDFQEVSQDGLKKGEMFGAPIALLILIVVLGALVAAVIPLIMAIFAIVLALGLASLVGQLFELSFFVENIIFMIGLAVGIDYSLFVVSRYREERGRGLEKLEAIARAGGTANRTVVFSGMTVVVGLVGMLLVPSNVFIGIGLAAIFVVVASVFAALTLLPAILGLLGDRINKLPVPFVGRSLSNFDYYQTGGLWGRVARRVMQQPVISLVLASGLLIASLVSFFDINTGSSGVSSFPDAIESKEGFLILDEKFSAGEVTPAEVVIDGDIDSPAVQAAIQRLTAIFMADPEFDTPRPLIVSEARDLALLSVPVAGDSASKKTENVIKKLRAESVPSAFEGVLAKVYVTGQTAKNIDFAQMAKEAALVVIPFVLAVSLILLMLVFRSIVVPIKAIILNLLSVGATYGILVLVFQKGVLAGTFGFQEAESIEAWIPIFLFAILFGLSMDYHVFLLSRMRERFDQTQDNTESVAFGIRSTGRLITGAALIMVAVFWGFAAGDLVGLQQMGFGLGLAVLLDATIVRIILVPASMKLLGKWNWYLPKWLEWLPDLRVEARREHPVPAPADD